MAFEPFQARPGLFIGGAIQWESQPNPNGRPEFRHSVYSVLNRRTGDVHLAVLPWTRTEHRGVEKLVAHWLGRAPGSATHAELVGRYDSRANTLTLVSTRFDGFSKAPELTEQAEWSKLSPVDQTHVPVMARAFSLLLAQHHPYSTRTPDTFRVVLKRHFEDRHAVTELRTSFLQAKYNEQTEAAEKQLAPRATPHS